MDNKAPGIFDEEPKEYRFSIPGNPITKKNSQRIIRIRTKGGAVRSLIKPSPQFEAYQLKAEYFLQPAPLRPISYPVNIQYVYYMETRRLVDLPNLISATDDILCHVGILVDDNRNIVAGHDGSRVYYDRESPRVEIVITPMEGYPVWPKGKERPVEPRKRGKKKKAVRAMVKPLPADPDFDEEHWD